MDSFEPKPTLVEWLIELKPGDYGRETIIMDPVPVDTYQFIPHQSTEPVYRFSFRC
jgi:hypothetical protein